MERRTFLTLLAAGAVSALGGAGLVESEERRGPHAAGAAGTSGSPATVESSPSAAPESGASATEQASPSAGEGSLPTGVVPANPPPTYSATPGLPPSEIHSLPGTGNDIALTIDDGVDSAVVAAYAQFAEESGVRLTFFVNGVRPSWTDSAAALRPMVDSGQIQLANHTWDHPDVRGLSDSALVRQLQRNDQFLANTYGVDGRPYFRPPYGLHNLRTDATCANEGYSSITLWYGSLGDAALLTPQVLLAQAQQWLTARRIVIGHANHPTVTQLYPQLLEILQERKLKTITLNDAFKTAASVATPGLSDSS